MYEELICVLHDYGAAYRCGENLGREIDGTERFLRMAATAIEEQSKQIDALRAENEHIRQNSVSQEVYQQLVDELAAVKQERDAAVKDIPHDCQLCAHKPSKNAPKDDWGLRECECCTPVLYSSGAVEMREKLMRYEDADESNYQMNDEPRECPYCGSGDIEVCIVSEAYCRCNDCGAEGPIVE